MIFAIRFFVNYLWACNFDTIAIAIASSIGIGIGICNGITIASAMEDEAIANGFKVTLCCSKVFRATQSRALSA
ncbi:hypothetical protein B0H67DRAFT_645898 [Lasiosphaeris hirsuta]|uniref:Uncharacterized protein n=1 Tax=Lasiosphaeris hirsuta TaxID=260670 RepID=A0AA40DYH3_9PEZI|nr:hypothetical protein B0H67DRAFT_645898 [Lasiosphaeris hirsuta]